MKKQLIGTLLASAVILTAIGAAGFANERMGALETTASGEVVVTVEPWNADYQIVDPLDGAVISTPTYTMQVETLYNEELRFYHCYGAEITSCGQLNGGDGVGYVSSLTVNDPANWTTQSVLMNFPANQPGVHRLMVVGYIGGVAVDGGRYVDVHYEPAAEPNLIVQEVVDGTERQDGVWVLPEGESFQVTFSYNDISSLQFTINGEAVTPISCTPISGRSGTVTCTFAKPATDEVFTLVASGLDASGNVVAEATLRAVDGEEIAPPDTGVIKFGSFTFAQEDLFLSGVVALLALGLAIVYILFRRASRR